jgi:hypothetical protein
MNPVPLDDFGSTKAQNSGEPSDAPESPSRAFLQWKIARGDRVIGTVRRQYPMSNLKSYQLLENQGRIASRNRTLLFVGCFLAVVFICIASVPLMIFVVCGGDVAFGPGVLDFSADLPGNCYIWRSSAHQISVEGNIEIPPKIIELDHDQKHLIVKRQLLKRRTPQNANDTYMEPDPGAYEYYIAEFASGTLYGPFDSIQFEGERLRLEVSPKLQLHDVYDYEDRTH